MTAIVTIVMFLLLITIHEFGHFIMAKTVGIKVLEFAIGMGPAILKKQGKETLYTIRILPIGGYCKMEGEDSESTDERGFSAKPVWQRMLVVVAGAFLNILLGFVLVMVHMSYVQNIQPNTIANIDPNSYLIQAGVRNGDEIVKFNNHRIGSYDELRLYTSEMRENQPIDLVIKRDDEKIGVTVMPSSQKVIYNYTDTGVEITEYINDVRKDGFVPYSDQLVKRDDMVGKTTESSCAILGFTVESKDVTIKNIIPESLKYTKFVIKLVYVSVFKMITGEYGLNQMTGPVGIVSVLNEVVKTKFINVIYLVSLITINLGVFNLLPLPALDGGRLLFMIVELVRGKPIPPEKEGLVHTVGFILLMLFSVFVLYNDIVRLFAK